MGRVAGDCRKATGSGISSGCAAEVCGIATVNAAWKQRTPTHTQQATLLGTSRVNSSRFGLAGKCIYGSDVHPQFFFPISTPTMSNFGQQPAVRTRGRQNPAAV